MKFKTPVKMTIRMRMNMKNIIKKRRNNKKKKKKSQLNTGQNQKRRTRLIIELGIHLENP
jgi:hypothetical protein